MNVGVRELKQHLAEYLDRAAAGELVQVTERGVPKVQIVPVPGAGQMTDGVEQGWLRPALRADGLQLRLLSGDAGARVHTLAAELAVDQAQGQASPEDKLRLMAQAQAEGHRVAMVGDGVNDAPVLARADVSLAMGHGAAVAQAQADVLLANGHLEGLMLARRTGRLSRRIVRQNLLWALAYNAACIPLALAGYLPPWAAGLGMALSSLGVVLNALRAGRVAPVNH